MTFTARTETYVNVSSLTTPFNFTLNKPAGTVDGDILFTFLCIRATTPPTVDSVPAGWNLIATRLVSTYYRFYLYYKVASGEGASWTWSMTATCKLRAVCSCYTSGDFKASDPIDVFSNTQYITSNTILRAASMNVTAANSPLLFFGAVYHTADENLTKPSVPTSDWVQNDEGWNTTSDYAWIVCSMVWTGSGATGNMDATISASDAQKHAFAVALKPSAKRTVTEGLTLADSVAIQKLASLLRSPADSLALADAVSILKRSESFLSPVDGFNVSDSVSVSLVQGLRTISLSLTDAFKHGEEIGASGLPEMRLVRVTYNVGKQSQY